MSVNKIANLQLETTAQYQNLSQLNVQFWNQDQSTAILQFQITRNDYPLSLSEENVKVFIALETGDSFLVDDNFNYLDQLNGVISYDIPNDFMKLAKNVTGQVYVTTLDEEEVVVQRKFSFNVANDLISNLPAEDKIREIKYFSDMRAEVAEMMTKLNSDFENMNDYVTQVQDTTQQGITTLTKLIDDKEKAYNDNHEAKMKELNDKGTEYSAKFDDDKQYMDEKFTAFQSSVNGSGLVTTGQSKDWQKYKLTNDDGTRKYLNKGSFTDIKQLSPGFYETVTSDSVAQGFPSAIPNAAYVEIDIFKAAASRVQMKVTQSSNGRSFVKYVHTDGADNIGWKEIALIDSNNPFETIQGSQAKATTAENNAKQYTDTKVASLNVVLFDGTASGVGTSFQLNDTLDNYILLYVYGTYPGGSFVTMANPFDKTALVITNTNIVNEDGNGGGIYECKIDETSRQKLKISNDVYFDLGAQTGSGANANKTTITRIIGVKDTTKGVNGLTPVGSDKYATMTQLMSLTTQGTDWQIETNKVTNANTLVSAIHGGGIEAGTTELAKLTSELSKQNYYSFMGLLPSNNSELHVTSTRYDEPTLLSMLNVPYTVSIHGASGSDKIIYLGGADTDNMAIMSDKLKQAGFTVQTPPSGIEGGSTNNIVNRNARNKGIQLELTTALRQSLFADNNFARSNREDRNKWSEDMTKLATAISDAIKAFK